MLQPALHLGLTKDQITAANRKLIAFQPTALAGQWKCAAKNCSIACEGSLEQQINFATKRDRTAKAITQDGYPKLAPGFLCFAHSNDITYNAKQVTMMTGLLQPKKPASAASLASCRSVLLAGHTAA